MKVPPTISVVMPVYNRQTLIGRAIDSVIGQTMQDWELVVVDDGSTDRTFENILKVHDHRVHCIRQSHNHGGSAARNAALSFASGRLIAFLDSDDEWMPAMLRCCVEALRSGPESVGAVYVSAVVDDRIAGATSVRRARIAGDIHETLRRYNCVGSSSRVVVRRHVVREVGGWDERLPSCQDWDYWLRVAERYEFLAIDRPLVKYYQGHESISSDPHALVQGRERFWKKHAIVDCDEHIRGRHYFRLGHELCYQGEPKLGRSWMWRGLASARLAGAGMVLGLLASWLGTRRYRWLVGKARRAADLWA